MFQAYFESQTESACRLCNRMNISRLSLKILRASLLWSRWADVFEKEGCVRSQQCFLPLHCLTNRVIEWTRCDFSTTSFSTAKSEQHMQWHVRTHFLRKLTFNRRAHLDAISFFVTQPGTAEPPLSRPTHKLDTPWQGVWLSARSLQTLPELGMLAPKNRIHS